MHIGVIGCSRRVEELLFELHRIDENVRISGLCDPLQERVSKFHKLFSPKARVYGGYEDLVKSRDIEWIVVGSWNSLHARQVIAALDAGKNVFCEKPLATNFNDCLAVKNALLRSGKKLMIGFTLRYSPHYRKIRELINTGLIGKIVSLEFNETLNFNHGGHIMCCWRRRREFTGCHILEKCCHDIDVANWMVNSRVSDVASFGGLDFFKPENEHYMYDLAPNTDGHRAYCSWPTAHGANPFTSDKDIIDNQVCILQYENGVRATFHTNINSGIPERRIYILGTEGAIRADTMTGKLEYRKIGFETKLHEVETGAVDGHAGGDAALVDYWRRMLHEDLPSLTDAKTGIESAVTCFAADEAMLKRQVINLKEYWKQLDAVADDENAFDVERKCELISP